MAEEEIEVEIRIKLPRCNCGDINCKEKSLSKISDSYCGKARIEGEYIVLTTCPECAIDAGIITRLIEGIMEAGDQLARMRQAKWN